MADKDPAKSTLPARAQRTVEPISWLRRELDRVFDDFVRVPDRLFDFGASGFLSPNFPLVEVKDRNGEYKISADVPGFEADQISVSVSDGVLIITGEADESRKSEEDGLIVQERHCGSFERRIALPGAVAGDGLKAKLKHGVLKVSVPKAKTPSATPITVEADD